jgi:hypothetical protein
VLLGSVGRRVTAEARCPVIVVPRAAGRAIEELAESQAATPPKG